MNTQAHLLLAAALLCVSSNAGARALLRIDASASAISKGPRTAWATNVAVLAGAIAPDVSIFVMFGLARLRGLSHDVIWGELYYSSFWQNIGAITNSIPLYIALAILGLILRTRWQKISTALLVFALAALLHCFLDFPLHVDDGHAHFWPFSNWVYASSVSYWDSNHYGHYWQPVEFIIASLCVFTIWRKFTSVWARTSAGIALLSYPIMLIFWYFLT